jgi:ABC-type Fe3+ transport system permease subunit
VLHAALTLLLLACCATVAVGSEQPVQAETSDVSSVSTTQADPGNEAEKERAVTVGMLLLALVISVFAGLLFVVVLLGRRVRRMARKPTARIVPGDELWFLKPKKNEAVIHPAATPQEDEPPTSDADLPDGQ